jgi:hypothetical protein
MNMKRRTDNRGFALVAALLASQVLSRRKDYRHQPLVAEFAKS